MRLPHLFVPIALFTALCAAAASSDWPAWRGPTRDGHAAPGQNAPVKWSETENVLWRSPVRGKGHGSPTVAGDRIYLATADAAAQELLVLAFDRATGRAAWSTVVHRGPIESGNHKNSSAASATWSGLTPTKPWPDVAIPASRSLWRTFRTGLQ